MSSSKKPQTNLYLLQSCLLVVADPVQAPDSLSSPGEVVDEIGNLIQSSGESSELPKADANDLLMYKRHLGAIAALSGSRQLTGSKYFIPPSKKHLGSIAAAAPQGMGRTPAGRKLEMALPMRMDTFKRHLGSLMALTGAKPKPLTRSLKESQEYQVNPQPDTYDPDPMSFTNIYGQGSTSYEPQPMSLLEKYENLLSSGKALSPKNSGDSLEESFGNDGLDEATTFKTKRFLGNF